MDDDDVEPQERGGKRPCPGADGEALEQQLPPAKVARTAAPLNGTPAPPQQLEPVVGFGWLDSSVGAASAASAASTSVSVLSFPRPGPSAVGGRNPVLRAVEQEIAEREALVGRQIRVLTGLLQDNRRLQQELASMERAAAAAAASAAPPPPLAGSGAAAEQLKLPPLASSASSRSHSAESAASGCGNSDSASAASEGSASSVSPVAAAQPSSAPSSPVHLTVMVGLAQGTLSALRAGTAAPRGSTSPPAAPSEKGRTPTVYSPWFRGPVDVFEAAAPGHPHLAGEPLFRASSVAARLGITHSTLSMHLSRRKVSHPNAGVVQSSGYLFKSLLSDRRGLKTSAYFCTRECCVQAAEYYGMSESELAVPFFGPTAP